MLRASAGGRTPLLIVAFVLSLVMTAPTRGQTDSGVIADPISRRDVDRYAKRLSLSDEQRRAGDRLYDAYLDDHRRLRDDGIAPFTVEYEHFGGATTDIGTDVDAMREAVRALRQLHVRLRAIDERFFDRLSTMLSEDQTVRLPALRAARERARYLGGPAQRSYNAALDMDMSDVYHELADRVPEETRAQTDSIVSSYEARLGRVARAAHDFALEYNLWLAETVVTSAAAAALADDEDLSDFIHRAHALRQGQTELTAKACDVGDLHRELYERLAPVLEAEVRDALRDRFLKAMYRSVPASRGRAAEEIDRILAHDAVSPTLRAAVEAETAWYVGEADRVVAKMLDTVDAQRRSNASHSIRMMFDDDPYVYEDAADYERKLRRLERRLIRVNVESVDRLQALVDEHLPGRLTLHRPDEPKPGDLATKRGLHSSVSSSDGVPVYGYKHLSLDQLATQFGSGRPRLSPISKRDLARWAPLIAATDDQLVILDVIHDEYLDAFDALEDDGPLASLRDARSAFLARDDEGRPVIPTESDIRRLFSREQAAVQTVRDLDARFFEDLALVLGDGWPPERRARVESDRSRMIFLSFPPPSPYALFAFGSARSRAREGNEKASVDVATLVCDLELPSDQREATTSMIVDYEAAATTLFERAYLEVRRFDQERSLLMARHLRYDDEDGLVAEGMSAPPEMDETAKRVRAVLDELLALNQALRASLEAMLAEPHRGRFVAAYKRAAWPDVFRDSHAVQGLLESALTLDDLSPEQRETIADASLRYRQAYEGLCDHMIETVSDWETQRRWRFERKELSERHRHDLREVLRPDQVARVAGLGEEDETPGS